MTHPPLDASSDAAQVVPLLWYICWPKSVLDVGCNQGDWVWAFSDAGVTDMLGLDVEEMRKNLVIPEKKFQSMDLRYPFMLGRTYDLVLCLEVAEHLPKENAETLVKSISLHVNPCTGTVAFSAAQPGQGGFEHVNEQPLEYWENLFFKEGFKADHRFRKCLPESVSSWYRNNMIIFRR